MTPQTKVTINKLTTGVPGLDDILGGGLPEYSFNIIAGTPGCVVGLRRISESWAEEPGLLTPIGVDVASVVTHEVTLKQLRSWIDGTCRSPREMVLKERLKAMLPG